MCVCIYMHINERISNNGDILLNGLIPKMIRICMYSSHTSFGEEAF